jgi:hypothetical protein
MFGDTILSHRNGFKDTVRIKKLEGHTIQWLGGIGTPTADSALIINQIVGLQNAKVSAAYVRTADGCPNPGDTLTYTYSAGVIHNENAPLTVCDSSFYDAGGPVGNTGNNFTRTFTPGTPGTKMRLSFYRIDLAAFASIQVFDGANTSSPRIEAVTNSFNGNTVREFIASNQSGQLTVQFSIGSSQSQGWWAGLTCYTPEIYRTIESGNWITASNWEKKAPGGTYGPARRAPVKGDDSIYIRHNMTLTVSTPMDQVLIEPAGVLNLESPTVNFISIPAYKSVEQPEFLVRGTLNISPRVQIFGANGQMIVPGRLNNFGQIDLDSVVFNGTTPQTLGNFSGASGTMKRLHLNNPLGLTMGSDQEVRGITFLNGLINTNSENELTLLSEANILNNGHPGSYVNGPLGVRLSSGSGDRLFPIGKNGAYRPVLLSNSNANSEASDLFKAEVMSGPPPVRTLPPGLTKVSEVRYYRVTRTGNSGTDFSIALPYGTDDGVTDPSNLTIAKDNGAGAWIDIGGTPSGAAPGGIQSNVFNGFSDFVLANKTGGANPLPVTWLSFEATAINADAHLDWATSHEQRCAAYEVERSRDGVQFSNIGNEKCNNTLSQQSYGFVDANPGKGTFYYRIKQVDTDGKFEYSPVRKLSFGTTGKISIYPNPSRDRIMIAEIPGNSDIRLFDAGGRMVMQTRNAQPFAQLQVGHLPAGIYQLAVTTITGERVVEKVQIIK